MHKLSSLARLLSLPLTLLLSVQVGLSGPLQAAAGEISLASTSDTGIKGNAQSADASLSLTRTLVAFSSFANNLDAADSDFNPDIFVKDIATGDITLVSTSDAGVKGNNASHLPSLSSDSTRVAFYSHSTNLDPSDVDTGADVYVKDLVTGDLILASTSDNGVKGNGDSLGPSLAANATGVAFESRATNLDPVDVDSTDDVYVKDLVTRDITLASTSDAGEQGNNTLAVHASLSANGSRVSFVSQDPNLDPADNDIGSDVFVKNLATGDITLASTTDAGIKQNGDTSDTSLSADGTRVAFYTSATNLDPGDSDGVPDVYVKDLTTGDISLASSSDLGIKGNGQSASPSLSPDGTRVAFDSFATNLDPIDTDTTIDVYVKDLTGAAGPSADLSLTKSDSADPAAVGRRLSFRISVQNRGPETATGVTLTDELPAGVTFQAARPSQGTCVHAGGTVTCDLGILVNGGRARVSIRVQPNQAGVITNTADVSANEADPNPANNHDEETTTVQ